MNTKHLAVVLLSLLPLCSFSSSKTPVIELPITEQTDQQKSLAMIALDALQVNVPYKVTCNFDSMDNNSKLFFEPRLLASSAYGNVELNEQPLPGNTDYMRAGENELSFRLLISREDLGKYNRFTLSANSQTPLQINQCIASEENPNQDAAKMKVASNAEGGLFYAFNDTDKLVTVAVGNFWPTDYEIKPHDWRAVFVSTDNQNIHVKSIK